MPQDNKQTTCECGKHFDDRKELEQHRQHCPTAQASGGKQRTSGGQQVRGAGSSGSQGTKE